MSTLIDEIKAGGRPALLQTIAAAEAVEEETIRRKRPAPERGVQRGPVLRPGPLGDGLRRRLRPYRRGHRCGAGRLVRGGLSLLSHPGRASSFAIGRRCAPGRHRHQDRSRGSGLGQGKNRRAAQESGNVQGQGFLRLGCSETSEHRCGQIQPVPGDGSSPESGRPALSLLHVRQLVRLKARRAKVMCPGFSGSPGTKSPPGPAGHWRGPLRCMRRASAPP